MPLRLFICGKSESVDLSGFTKPFRLSQHTKYYITVTRVAENYQLSIEMNVANVNRALIGLQLSLALFACPEKQRWCTTCVKLDTSSARHNTKLTYCSSLHNMFGGLGVYFLTIRVSGAR